MLSALESKSTWAGIDLILSIRAALLVVKELVHPKMKIKSLITHPHAVPTP